MAFGYLYVDVDYGPGVGVRPFRILPWFASCVSDKETWSVMYFVPTVAWQGRVKIGKHEYDALLAQPYGVTGRFD